MSTEAIEKALLDAINDCRAAIDTRALMAAIERKYYAATLELLGVVNGEFPQLERLLANHFSELLAVRYERAAHSVNPIVLSTQLAGSSDLLRKAIISDFSGRTVEGIIGGLSTIMESDMPVEFRALALTRIVGLSERQARSLAEYAKGLAQANARIGYTFKSTIRIGRDVTTQTDILPRLDPFVSRFLSASQRSAIERALRIGSTPEEVERLFRRQAALFIKQRSKTVAEFNAAKVTEQAKHDAAKQSKDAGTIRRYWITAGDERVRDAHDATAAMNPHGVAVDQPFNTPLGSVMYPPLEPGCRCHVEYR